jgi:hypothetical protein
MATTLEGAAEVAINETLIPASMLSEIAVEFEEGVRERTTLGGRFRKPSGVLETAEVRFTLYLPSMDYLKNIFPGRYNAPTAPQTSGNLIINSDTCVSTDAGKVNIHWTCDENDGNDIYIYNGHAVLNLSMTINADDAVSVEVRILAEPDNSGNVARFGTGNLTAVSVYDPETETTVAA